MSAHPGLLRHPGGFGLGYTPITCPGEPELDTGMAFGILRLAQGERSDERSPLETAVLLLHGRVTFSFEGVERTCERNSLFDEEPFAVHLPAGARLVMRAEAAAELAVVRTENAATFPPRLFDPSSMLESEQRDKGRLDDTSYRIVRTVFDYRNRPEARLVLGEVITLPGRWSSYPPHHHPHPEIYHYRFTHPSGYGHGELGEDVLKIRPHDTVKIVGEVDHAQVAAPGYGMFYLWVIRHLEGNPYTAPTFTGEHRWLKEAAPEVWKPRQK